MESLIRHGKRSIQACKPLPEFRVFTPCLYNLGKLQCRCFFRVYSPGPTLPNRASATMGKVF